MSRFPDPESSLGKSWYPVALFIIITTVFYGLILHSSEISPTFAWARLYVSSIAWTRAFEDPTVLFVWFGFAMVGWFYIFRPVTKFLRRKHQQMLIPMRISISEDGIPLASVRFQSWRMPDIHKMSWKLEAGNDSSDWVRGFFEDKGSRIFLKNLISAECLVDERTIQFPLTDLSYLNESNLRTYAEKCQRDPNLVFQEDRNAFRSSFLSPDFSLAIYEGKRLLVES